METVNFITPIKQWESLECLSGQKEKNGVNEEAAAFKSIFDNVVDQVYTTQADVENKQYLMATGQLDDAHTLPIAEAKAALSLDVLISLRNKTMEAYNELIKMSV